MIRAGAPTCPNCGGRPGRQGLFCDGCWAEVPKPARKDVEERWKAYAARPGSAQLRAEYEASIAAAAGSVP